MVSPGVPHGKLTERDMLDVWWNAQPHGATLYTEVGIGGATTDFPDATERRLDGVVVRPTVGHDRRNKQDFARDSKTANWSDVDLIEVKHGLSELVLGQALVGRLMFERDHENLRVARTLVLYRHADAAMLWMAGRLGIKVACVAPPLANRVMAKRRHYALSSSTIARVVAARGKTPSAVLTRVPLGGPGCPVRAWEGSCEIFVEMVRLLELPHPEIVVCEGGEHFKRLAEQHGAEVIVARPKLGRGIIGLAYVHALMIKEQYGVEASASVVVERADPHLVGVATDLGVAVRMIAAVSASPDEADADLEEELS